MEQPDPSLYRSWSTGALIHAAAVDRRSYRPEALALIEAELERRGVGAEECEQARREALVAEGQRIQKLKGIAGSLLVFVVLVFLASAASIVQTIRLLEDEPALGFACFPVGMAGIYGCYVFVVLLRKETEAPKHARRWLIAHTLAMLFYAGVVFVLKEEVVLTLSYAGLVLGWLMWLEDSERIAATYGRPLEETPGALEGRRAVLG